MRFSPFHVLVLTLCIFLSIPSHMQAQHSVARQWNEVLLDGIRNDFARPTVHARNLFHVSVAMYDCWAAMSDDDDTYFLGNTIDGYTCSFEGFIPTGDVKEAQEEAMSYAAYRLMRHRFQNSPGIGETYFYLDVLMGDLGYDVSIVDTNYTTGSAAALGNYVAQQLIRFGMQDGANEDGEYANLYYEPSNTPLVPIDPGNPLVTDPNSWQPLTLDVFIDQSGNPIPLNTPDFLSPEWGNVSGFALTEADKTTYERDGDTYHVYHDPGPPPYFDSTGVNDDYKWGFSLVAVWASHLDTTDNVMWDISPAGIGNVPSIPNDYAEMRTFYDLFEGGDPSQGHTINPATNQPYETQMVRRGDYARVLAEFWADGPDSETPPGHWFTILNYVNDHPDLEKRFEGVGEVRDDLEWDVKAYFLLGGTMHDVAISAWGIKGYYDYIRPISAIRFMADHGQSTDEEIDNYSPLGIPLYPGYIETVVAGEVLAGSGNENVGKIKLRSWRGPDYIDDEEVDMAGVGWILAEEWWPYQRPSFITPPFAGFVSGHSTFSRAAAEVLTALTGDAFFPGGYGEFVAPKNEFLVFEEGPSTDVLLQWATYRDASDQCSLSRIWGGIHPPADDIPGRRIGITIGNDAFEKAASYFDINATPVVEQTVERIKLYPNPVNRGQVVHLDFEQTENALLLVYDASGKMVYDAHGSSIQLSTASLSQGVYMLEVTRKNGERMVGEMIVVE